MIDLHVPVTAITTAWFKAILKPTYLIAVDDGAHGEHDIFIRCSEVEIGGKPPSFPSRHFRKLVPPLNVRLPASKTPASASRYRR